MRPARNGLLGSILNRLRPSAPGRCEDVSPSPEAPQAPPELEPAQQAYFVPAIPKYTIRPRAMVPNGWILSEQPTDDVPFPPALASFAALEDARSCVDRLNEADASERDVERRDLME